jgi:vancomycin resistance protein YoaR
MKLLIHLKHPVFIAICFFALIGAVILGASEYYFANRFFPGTFIGGENLTGRTYQEVFERVRRVQDSLARDGLHIVIGSGAAEKKIIIPMRSTGLTPDVVIDYFSYGNPEKVLKEVFSIGHQGPLKERLKDQWRVRRDGVVRNYEVVVYKDAIRALIEQELESILPAPLDARFSLSGQSIKIIPEETGETVDTEAVVSAISDVLSKMQTNRLLARTNPLPAKVTAARLNEIFEFANSLAKSKPMQLIYDDGEIVYLGGARLASWLTIDPAKKPISLKILRNELSSFVRRYIDDDREEAPRNSRFMMSSKGVIVETAPGTIGMAVDVDTLASQIEVLLNAKYARFVSSGRLEPNVLSGEKMEVVFKLDFPAITSSTISGYGITDLLGVASTSFRGSSADRIKNIKLGAERAGGFLIAPGAEFSLVKALGEVSEETGYTKEFVIKGDRSVKEAGGGLCQIATTVFRGVLNSGLPVTERRNHSYVVGYYGPGLDATIYGPYPDLRFVNDTGRFILFQMRVEGTNLISEFYGTRDGRTATTTVPSLSDYIDPPPPKYIPDLEKPWGEIECHDQPRKGLTTQATTTVTYADGKVRTQVFDSVYQPWPKICIVGIKR